MDHPAYPVAITIRECSNVHHKVHNCRSLSTFAIIHDEKTVHASFVDEHESFKTCSCNFAKIIRERMRDLQMDDIRLEIMMKEQEAVLDLYKTAKLENPDMNLEDIKVIVGEKITARIAEYEQLIFTMKTRQQLLFSHKQEILHSLDVIRAEKLRAKDKLYKAITPDAAGEARERLTAREKQVKSIQKVFACSRDEAEAFLLNPAKIPGKVQDPTETQDPAPTAQEVSEPSEPAEETPPLAVCSSCNIILSLDRIEKGICEACEGIPANCEKCGVEIDSGKRCSDCLVFS